MWTTDGSSEITAQGNKVECRVLQSSGNVYNAIWKSGKDENSSSLEGGKAYWKVKCEEISEGSLFAGVTDLKKFRKGWACKGLFYGGNLSDGGGLLVSNFGPCLKAGDVFGIFVHLDADTLKVHFDINGSSLGVAFDVPKDTLEQIFPAVHFSGPGAVTIEQSSEFPSIIREETKFEGIEGNWEYTVGPFDTAGQKIHLDIKSQGGNRYRAALRVINRINVNLTRESETGYWIGQVGATTLMGGPPELMALESQLTEHMRGHFSLENEQLSIEANRNKSVWNRFTVTKNPVTSNPFSN